MKRLHVLTVTGIISLILSICSMASERAFVIPVETEIDLGAAHHFRTAMEEARTNGADIIIVKLNTYGGALDAWEACGECESCRAIDRGNSFNLSELDAASNNRVEDIRQITEQVNVPPQVGKYRVFIIDEIGRAHV